MPESERLATALSDRYTFERELGAGGMATVYLAHDVRHDRKVALKVLRPELAAVIGAERFLAEIRTTANLQHPHILPLHDSGEADGFLFYVMPYVEGESLRDLLEREKQLPVNDAVRIASEVADALDYAHRHGVIHRDIKPENILLHDGRAMVADFGIALAASKGGATRMTETGMSLGTPQYMSPEQAMGEREITARSDVYALGAVLYEMLSGDPPFSGSTAQAIVARVVTESPRPLTVQRHTVPPNVESAVLKALEKLPADRFGRAAEFAAALRDSGYTTQAARYSTAATTAAASATGWRDWRLWASACAALVVLLGYLALRPNPAPPVTRHLLATTGDQHFGRARGNRLALSSDGQWLAYAGTGEASSMIWVRRQDQLQAEPLLGTEKVTHLFFEPAGSRVGFITDDADIKIVSLTGGSPITVTDEQVGIDGGTWSDDGYIYYDGLTQGTTNGLRRVRATGGAPVELVSTVDTAKGETDHIWPVALPGGKAVLFTIASGGGVSQAQIGLLDVATGEHRTLINGVTAHYLDPGYLLLVSNNGALLAAPFDLGRMDFSGEPVSLAEEVAIRPFGAVDMAVSANGKLVYGRGGQADEPGEVVQLDMSGVASPIDPGWVGDFRALSLSPDGTRLAVSISEGTQSHVWVKVMPDGPLTRITFDGQNNIRPSWTPDGRDLIFISDIGGNLNLMKKRADGSRPAELALDLESPLQDAHYSPDGRWLIYRVAPRDIYALSETGDTVAVAATQAEERAPAISPDGRWIAYMSDETGFYEVYVRPFPDASSARWQVSNGAGGLPLWAPDGSSLYYQTNTGEIIQVEVLEGPTFIAGERRVLFRSPGLIGFEGSWDITPDGGSFLAIKDRGMGQVDLVMVDNLTTELEAIFK